jgi:hypothetical protein
MGMPLALLSISIKMFSLICDCLSLTLPDAVLVKQVTAAFAGTTTNFGLGNADFSVYDMDGTTEAITTGTVLLNVWMHVIGKMERAIDDCNNGCDVGACNNDGAFAWDEAVAFYFGSVPKSTGEGGYLLYSLAQKFGELFGTCLNVGSFSCELAYVNSEILEMFKTGKQDLMMGNCEVARNNVKAITELLTVPLIQGTLRYAYIMGKLDTKTDRVQAQGAVYAAAVLPLIHYCSPQHALIIYDNMRVGNEGQVDFEAVKATFEQSYECLGITCDHIGGLVDVVNGGFLEKAEPCCHVRLESPTGTATARTSGLGFCSSVSQNGHSTVSQNGDSTVSQNGDSTVSQNGAPTGTPPSGAPPGNSQAVSSASSNSATSARSSHVISLGEGIIIGLCAGILAMLIFVAILGTINAIKIHRELSGLNATVRRLALQGEDHTKDT